MSGRRRTCGGKAWQRFEFWVEWCRTRENWRNIMKKAGADGNAVHDADSNHWYGEFCFGLNEAVRLFWSWNG